MPVRRDTYQRRRASDRYQAVCALRSGPRIVARSRRLQVRSVALHLPSPNTPMHHCGNIRSRRIAATLVAVIVGLALLGTSGAMAETLELVPVLEVTEGQEVIRTERMGAWTYDAPGGVDSGEATTEPARRQVLFLLDVSASMPTVLRARGGLNQVADEVVERAREMLEPYVSSDGFEVSFYTFGHLCGSSDSGYSPCVEPLADGIDVDVETAIELIDPFVLRDPSAYRHRTTYVAASIYQAVREELGLPQGEPVDLDADAPPVAVFVFTDAGDPQLGGGESHDPAHGFDNTPYLAWRQRHVDNHQLEYHYWNLEEIESEVLRAPPQQTYLVGWTDSGRAASVQRHGEAYRGERELAMTSTLRLVPALADTGVEPTCRSAGDGASIRRTGRIIDLRRIGPAMVRLGELASYPDGDYALRFDAEALCAELASRFPNSAFVLPSFEDAPFGAISFVSGQAYGAVLSSSAAVPDAPLDRLTADRQHRYRGGTREFWIEVPSVDGLDVRTTWSLSIAPPEGVDADIEALGTLMTSSGEPAGFTATTRGDERVTLAVPALQTPWWARVPFLGQLLYTGPRPIAPGEYRVSLCGRVYANSVPMSGDAFELRGCPACEGSVVDDDRLCLDMTETVDAPPLHWFWCVVLALVLLWLAARTIRFLRWPAFPERTVLSTGHVEQMPRILGPRGRMDRWLWRYREECASVVVYGESGEYVSATGGRWSDLPPLGTMPNEVCRMSIVPHGRNSVRCRVHGPIAHGWVIEVGSDVFTWDDERLKHGPSSLEVRTSDATHLRAKDRHAQSWLGEFTISVNPTTVRTESER